MRLATLHIDGGLRAALLVDEELRLLPSGLTVQDIIGGNGVEVVEDARTSGPAMSMDDAHFAAPVPAPPSLRDFVAFEGHVRNVRAARGAQVPEEWYRVPAFYFGNTAGLLGARDPVRVPPGTEELDFELEVAVVVGRPGRNLHPATAGAHVAGLTLMSDWSARDIQRREQQIPMGPAKSKDFATSFGPFLVTMDELTDRTSDGRIELALRASVNEQTLSEGCLSDTYWTIGEILAYASRGTELRTGDVIGLGTCPTGCLLELRGTGGDDAPPWLTYGDTVELSGERLGEIRATVIEGEALIPLRQAEPVPAGAVN